MRVPKYPHSGPLPPRGEEESRTASNTPSPPMRNLRLYYSLKTMLPRPFQIRLRQMAARRKRRHVADVWPILESAGQAPEGWKGWPEGKRFALVLTHDVETRRGLDRCRMLMDVEERKGFRAAFNFVPQRYDLTHAMREEMAQRCF